MTPRCGLVFHFTHLDNLPAILGDGALLCDSLVCERGCLEVEAGDREIKQRRRTRRVPCGSGGVVADYVPFYFASRSPMMYKLSKGSVPSFKGSVRDLVYLVGHASDIAESGADFVISNRNAAVAVAEFSRELSVLGDLTVKSPTSDFIDWPLMNAQYWNSTLEFPDRMEKRMAEFLVRDRVPLVSLSGAATYSQNQKAILEQMFDGVDLKLSVAVRPDWYY